MNRVLMVAFHFPPLSGGSGIQRTLRFVQNLPDFSWQPLVLSAHPQAYAVTSDDLMAELPQGLIVQRPFALDTARHLAVKGRYAGWMARPDRWVSWKFAAIHAGMAMIRRYRPKAIWTTYPIATAHMIGAALQRRSGLPWIADFRDPMAQTGYPADPATWKSFKRIEEHVFARASHCVFTTPRAARDYSQRYPESKARIAVIENGYDEQSFAALNGSGAKRESPEERLVVLHSGIVYPSERDPLPLFQALNNLMLAGEISPKNFCLRFRAPVHVDLLQQLSQRFGLEALIEIAPAIPYRDALQEMMHVDGLLILQAANCNAQIPAKYYEYLRAGKPIIGLTDPRGDTASALRSAGIEAIASLDSAVEIAACIGRFVADLQAGIAMTPNAGIVHSASRYERTRALAHVLNQAVDG